MKRSEINRALRELEAMCEKYRCYLPPFCRFTPEEWKTKGHEYDEVRECMLGWDITDYGLGNFDKIGFSLITIRNGSRKQPEKYPKVYAEKLLFLKEYGARRNADSPHPGREHFHLSAAVSRFYRRARHGSIAVIADSPSVKQSTQPVTITVTALGSSIRPASTDVRITAGTAAQQIMTTQHTVIATVAGTVRAAASIAAP